MAKSSSTPSSLATQARRSRQRIEQIRAAIGQTDHYLCSGTLHEHLTRCGKPGCRCADDPAARHGPYFDWGHMQAGKLVRRRLSAEQAQLIRRAIDNYRKVKQLLREWETETERLIQAEAPRDH